MELNDLLALVRAGYTKADIEALTSASEAVEKAKENEQPAAKENTPAAAVEAAPAHAEAAEAAPAWAQQMLAQMQAMNMRTVNQPAGSILTAEQAAQNTLIELAGMPAKK